MAQLKSKKTEKISVLRRKKFGRIDSCSSSSQFYSQLIWLKNIIQIFVKEFLILNQTYFQHNPNPTNQ